MSLQQIQAMLQGETLTEDVIRRDILRRVLYRKAKLLAVGTKIVPEVTFGELDVKFEYPSEIAAEYPVAAGARAARQVVTWSTFNMVLEKAEIPYLIGDEAKLRQLENIQVQTSIRRAAEALAYVKDQNIVNALVAAPHTGAGQYVAVAAGAEWNAFSSTTDIQKDVAKAWELMLKNSNMNETELAGLVLMVPTTVMAAVNTLQLIGNIQQSMRNYLKQAYDMVVSPSRFLDGNDAAYLCKPGEDIGIHGVLETNIIPLTEEQRIVSVGTEYVTRQYFNTKIFPESASDAYSWRVIKINNVEA